MPTYRYLHLDVFTDRPFEGNQLAVFPEPRGLAAAEMQTIAREMNFSESTFVFPAEPEAVAGGRTDVRMRIFTPGAELPIAGHPTIGTTFALAAEGTIAHGRQDFVFGLGVGPTPVSLEWKGDVLDFAWMTQPLPTFGAQVQDRARLAAALGLDSQDLPPEPAPQVVSCGNAFLFVRVASRQAVDAVSIDRKALAACLRSAGLDETAVFLFALEPPGSEATVYSRMLAPGFGISEDPATGSASGPLGCYLFHHKVVTAAQAASLLSLQGVAMQRPSRLFISIEIRGDAITRVRVGGRAVLVGRGELTV